VVDIAAQLGTGQGEQEGVEPDVGGAALIDDVQG
jgi:hypothetical protein